MRPLIGFLLMLILMISIVFGAVYLFYQLIFGSLIRPGSKSFMKIVEGIRTQLAPARQLLIPWESDTLSMMAAKPEKMKSVSALSNTSTGEIATIYKENIGVLALQKTGTVGLSLIQTKAHEFIYHLKSERETEIWVDNQPFGVLVDGVLISSGRQGIQLARVTRENPDAPFLLAIKNETAASIANKTRLEGVNQRAITLLRDLTAEDEIIAQAIVFRYLYS